jgi:hypothetical protein
LCCRVGVDDGRVRERLGDGRIYARKSVME